MLLHEGEDGIPAVDRPPQHDLPVEQLFGLTAGMGGVVGRLLARVVLATQNRDRPRAIVPLGSPHAATPDVMGTEGLPVTLLAAPPLATVNDMDNLVQKPLPDDPSVLDHGPLHRD